MLLLLLGMLMMIRSSQMLQNVYLEGWKREKVGENETSAGPIPCRYIVSLLYLASCESTILCSNQKLLLNILHETLKTFGWEHKRRISTPFSFSFSSIIILRNAQSQNILSTQGLSWLYWSVTGRAFLQTCLLTADPVDDILASLPWKSTAQSVTAANRYGGETR